MRTTWGEFLCSAIYVSWDIELERVPVNFISFKTKCNIIVPICVFLDLVHNWFTCFHIDRYIFLCFLHIHRYNTETCKVNRCCREKCGVSSVLQRKKTGCNILAFSGFEWVLQDCRSHVNIWTVWKISVILWLCQRNRSLFLCLFVC